MAKSYKITWLGEDELHGPEGIGPSATTWAGLRFPKGEAVHVTDQKLTKFGITAEAVANKARGNRFFKVEDAASKDEQQAEQRRTTEAETAGKMAEGKPGRNPPDLSSVKIPPLGQPRAQDNLETRQKLNRETGGQSAQGGDKPKDEPLQTRDVQGAQKG